MFSLYVILISVAVFILTVVCLYWWGSYWKKRSKAEIEKTISLAVKVGVEKKKSEDLREIADIVETQNKELESNENRYDKARKRIEVTQNFQDLYNAFKEKYGNEK